MSTFPNGIWNGVTDGRPDLTVVNPPTHNDWRLMLHELVAIQRYVLNLASNIKNMPNITDSIKVASRQMQIILDRLNGLAPPPHDNDNAVKIRKQLIELQKNHSSLKIDAKKLSLRARIVETRCEKLAAEVAEKTEIIGCGVRNQLADFTKKIQADQLVLQKQIDELHDALIATDI